MYLVWERYECQRKAVTGLQSACNCNALHEFLQSEGVLSYGSSKVVALWQQAEGESALKGNTEQQGREK